MPKPIFNSQIASEFGEVENTEAFKTVMDADHTYVPGWSEKRRERDQQVAEVVRGERQGHDVLTLPGNVRWTRTQTPNLKPEGIKLLGVSNKGYRAVGVKDIGPGKMITAIPPGAHLAADGTIVKNDVTLMICSREQAAANAAAKARLTQARLETDNEADGLFGVKERGASPSVKKLKGDAIAKTEVFSD